MKLEQQVCNLELSKKLKKLGVKQESLFYWVESGGYIGWELEYDVAKNAYHETRLVSAFTVAELGELLPQGFMVRKWTKEQWEVLQDDKVDDGLGAYKGNVETEKTEANARAKMLIYLIEQKLITL